MIVARLLHIGTVEVVRPQYFLVKWGRNRDEAVPGLLASVGNPGRNY